MNPQLAPAHYNNAVLLAHEGRQVQAISALERSLALEDDPISRSEYEARFYLDVITDNGPALVALRRYRDHGGEDPELLSALDDLNTLNLVVFETFEVDVIQARTRP